MDEEIRIGVDIGAVSVSLAVLRRNRLAAKAYRFNRGDIGATLAGMLKRMRGIDIPPELDGETSLNILKSVYYLQYLKPDGFVHVNPLYCCPGAVSSALLSWVEKQHGVPVINLFCDGLHNPNENLEPSIYYLRHLEAKSGAQKIAC